MKTADYNIHTTRVPLLSFGPPSLRFIWTSEGVFDHLVVDRPFRPVLYDRKARSCSARRALLPSLRKAFLPAPRLLESFHSCEGAWGSALPHEWGYSQYLCRNEPSESDGNQMVIMAQCCFATDMDASR
jgi:hypothetical protein